MHNISVLGVSELLLDRAKILALDEAERLFNRFQLKKGDGKQTSLRSEMEAAFNEASASLESVMWTPGGSGSNALKVMSQIGGYDVSLLAMVGDDNEGKWATERLNALGIRLLNVQPDSKDNENSTGIVNCFITFDSVLKVVQRTMLTFLGIASQFTDEHVKEEYFKEKRCVFLDGYHVYHKGVLEKGIRIANEQGALTVLGLPNPYPVENNRTTFLECAQKVDYIFGNKMEYNKLTGHDDPVAALNSFDKAAFKHKVLVLTGRADGCWVKPAGTDEVLHFDAIKVDERKILDPTGAGDFFLGGFMSGALAGKNTAECVRLGNLAASFVIQHLGADLPNEKWKELKTLANEILADSNGAEDQSIGNLQLHMLTSIN